MVAEPELGRREGGQEMPLPRNWNTVFLGILTMIAVLTCLYVARNIVLPVVLALVLKLLFQPLVKLLERVHIPKIGGALISLLLLLGVFVGLGALLSSPAARWAGQLPQAWPMLQQRFAVLQKPIAHLEHVLDSMGVHLDGGDSFLSHPVSMVTDVFSGTGTVASNLLETLLVLFYLLVFGETFLRRLVEVLPRFDDKREAVEISMHMERDLSAYLLTITVINAVVGCATALVMWICGVPGPILWGVVAFCPELCADPRPVFRHSHVPGRRHRDRGLRLDRHPAGLSLFRHPYRGGRNHHAHAAGKPFHHQPGGGDAVAHLLVLDVGRGGSDPRRADAGHYQDHL